MVGIAEEDRDVLGLILWVDDFEREEARDQRPPELSLEYVLVHFYSMQPSNITSKDTRMRTLSL